MLADQVAAYMQAHHMTEPGSLVLVGISGGADSVCLLSVLAMLRETLQIRLHGVHVHHGIRGAEADEDAAYAEDLCRALQVPCEVYRADVPGMAAQWHMSLEEAARKVRYEAFREIGAAIGAQCIGVAHHREDQEETILMHLFRGSGLRGAAGMEPAAAGIIRPLLDCSREEIEDFLREQGIAWQTDSTNFSEEYTRNYVRQSLLPDICARFPQAGKHLRSFGVLAGETDDYLMEQGGALFQQYGTLTENGCRIRSEGFREAHPVIRPYLLRYAMKQARMPLKDISAHHLTILGELFAKEAGKRIHLPAGYEAVKEYEGIWLGKGGRTKSGVLPKMCQKVFFYEKSMKFPEKPYEKWFDYDKITETVVLRTRETGDRFSPLPEGSKKLKDYMIDAKIPRELRDTIPLVAMGSTILWVVGYRMSEAYKVTGETRRILQITIEQSK